MSFHWRAYVVHTKNQSFHFIKRLIFSWQFIKTFQMVMLHISILTPSSRIIVARHWNVPLYFTPFDNGWFYKWKTYWNLVHLCKCCVASLITLLPYFPINLLVFKLLYSLMVGASPSTLFQCTSTIWRFCLWNNLKGTNPFCVKSYVK